MSSVSPLDNDALDRPSHVDEEEWALRVKLACETQMLSSSMPGEEIEVSREATEHSTRDGRLFGSNDGQINLEMFAALQRIVDSKDPSYRR